MKKANKIVAKKSTSSQAEPLWKKALIAVLFVLLVVFYAFTPKPSEQDLLAQEYVETFKDLAIVEMHRTGVPASITLAQGLHETNFGQSKLARVANNHFGIKCKNYWTGETYYHEDDDYDKSGNLIKSCFRQYDSAILSYVDHSNFLLGGKHYASLFDYDKTDYESWAHGLKRCGYATDPTYAQKLISKIEKYNLSQYDFVERLY